jgi:hypothetical protein
MSYFPKDTTPINGSTNVIESNAVFDVLDAKANVAGQTFTGGILAPSIANVAQANTPTGTTYAWVLTGGNDLVLNLATATGDVVVTTSAPAIGSSCTLTVKGSVTLALRVTLSQSGVTWIARSQSVGTTVDIGTLGLGVTKVFSLYWSSATMCVVEEIGNTNGTTWLGSTMNADAFKVTALVPMFSTGLSAFKQVFVYSVGRTIYPSVGEVYRFTASSQTFTINPTNLQVGDMFYLCISSGCPAHTLVYTDAFAIPRSVLLSEVSTYCYTVQRLDAGLAMYGGKM